jgi:hypothetical protein
VFDEYVCQFGYACGLGGINCSFSGRAFYHLYLVTIKVFLDM